MFRRFLLVVSIPLYAAGLIYLSLPDPKVAHPPNTYLSQEPGDTWQNPGQTAYYTDESRQQVLNFQQSDFSIKFLNFTLPSYRLNYRPEDTATYIRPHILAYYLEEIIHPFRESLFVGGWTPKLSPISSQLYQVQYDRWALIREGHEYQSRITLRPYYSPLWVRYLIFTAIFPLTYFVFLQLFSSLKQLTMVVLSRS